MSKILGLDYGEKRCGISITDDLRLIASPLDTINTNEIINYLVEIIARENISILVIGEPKNNKNNFFEIEESIKKLIKKESPKIVAKIENKIPFFYLILFQKEL